MVSAELIQKLRSTAGAMARQGNHEARDLMNEAADVIEDLDERVSIMEEGNNVTIQPGADVDLWPALARISQDKGQITKDEMLKGGAP